MISVKASELKGADIICQWDDTKRAYSKSIIVAIKKTAIRNTYKVDDGIEFSVRDLETAKLSKLTAHPNTIHIVERNEN